MDVGGGGGGVWMQGVVVVGGGGAETRIDVGMWYYHKTVAYVLEGEGGDLGASMWI